MRCQVDGVERIIRPLHIKGFEKDFRAMHLLMKEYANFLKISAKAYRDMQNDRVAQARRLAN